MLTFFIIILTIALVIDCVLLGLLIMIQLPKKEAGMGVAFGAGATDALFGAGSGTALTTLTKYTGIAFFVLVFVLSLLKIHASHSGGSDFERAVDKAPALEAPATTNTTAPAASTNTSTTTNPANPQFNLAPGVSNAAAAAASTATNSPGPAAK